MGVKIFDIGLGIVHALTIRNEDNGGNLRTYVSRAPKVGGGGVNRPGYIIL